MAFKSLRDPATGRQVARYDPDTDQLEIRADVTSNQRRRFSLAPLRQEAGAREVDPRRRRTIDST